jgi:hypothetical protein
MKMNRKFSAVVIVGCILILVGFLTMLGLEDNTKMIKLDLSTTRQVSVIGLSADTQWTGGIAGVDRTNVNILFPGGHSYKGYIDLITLHRSGDIVDSIGLNLKAETIDEVYKEAMQFTKDWNLPTDKLEEWRVDAISGKWNVNSGTGIAIYTTDRTPTIDLEIRPTSGIVPSKPACIIFELDWTTTSPSTNPTTREE